MRIQPQHVLGAMLPVARLLNSFNKFEEDSQFLLRIDLTVQPDRSRSVSKKRKMEDGNNVSTPAAAPAVKKQNRPGKLNTGTGCSGRAGAGKHVASFQMFVGRTHPDTTESDIRELVIENTITEDTDGVKLENVDFISELKDDKDRIISKGWRVSMSYNDKEIMMKESSWPAGWSFRQYYAPRQKPELYKAGVKLA